VPSRSRSLAFAPAAPDVGVVAPCDGCAALGTLAADPGKSRFCAAAHEAAAIANNKATTRIGEQNFTALASIVELRELDTDNPTFRHTAGIVGPALPSRHMMTDRNKRQPPLMPPINFASAY
jgi:hypothetical protein